MATEGNDNVTFSWTTELVSATFTNVYSGHTISVDQSMNVNNAMYDGLGGVDTLFMSATADLLTVQNTLGQQTLFNIEIIQASSGDDLILLSSTAIVLGDMTINGANGSDVIWANAGNDTINGGSGNDIIDGGPGSDNIRGDNDNDTIYGGDGNDTIRGGNGHDTMYGGAGDDAYIAENFLATPFSDSIVEVSSSDSNNLHLSVGQALADMAFAPDGQDLVLSAAGSNSTIRIVGQFNSTDSGIDTIVFSDNSTFELNAPIVFSNGAALAYAENDAPARVNNVLTLDDDDSANLIGATVSITDHFAPGQDVLGFVDQNGIAGSYNSATGVLTLSGIASISDYQAALRSITYSNSSTAPSEAVRIVSFQVNDGNFANNLSNIGTTTISVTNAASAVFVPETTLATTADEHFNGTDLSNPATPLKLISYENSAVGVTVDLAQNTSSANTASGGDAQGDYFTNINAITGSSHADSLTGNGVANLLTGGTGIDTLSGGAGDDTFVVVAGDTASGESYDGGDDTDTLQIDGGGTVDLTGVTFSNMENAVITNATGTRVILSTAQISAFTGTLDAQGTGDAFAIGDFAFLTTFGSPATRASAFELIQDLHAGGVEGVEWQEAGATTVATVSGGNVVVTSTDPAGASGGLSWTTSVFTFDGTTGERLTKVTTMDDGSVITRTFSGDVALSDETAGMAGPTESITVVYDAAGRVDSRTVTYDDGSSVETFYDDDNRVDSRTNTASSGFATTTFFDDNNRRVQVYSDDSSSNIYGWENSTLTLDPLTGQVTEKFTELDNFNTVTETYSGGVLTLRATADGGDNEAFTSATQHFAAGIFQWQSIIYDNGTGLIQGSGGANTISQNDGIADAIIGGGGADTFVFNLGGGADRVLDFSQAQGDKLDLRAFGVDQVSEITSYTQTGANLVMNFGGGDTVQINNMTYAALTNADLVA